MYAEDSIAAANHLGLKRLLVSAYYYFDVNALDS